MHELCLVKDKNMTVPLVDERLQKVQLKTIAEQSVLCVNNNNCQTNALKAESRKEDDDKNLKYRISVIRSLSALENYLHEEKNESKKLPYGGRPLRFECAKCMRRFHAPSHLKRHMLCHSTERPFQCYVCNKGFLQAWHLGRHMTTHTGNKPFTCQECSKSFGSRFEMKTHYNYIHQGIKEHKCGVCQKMFTLRSNLKVHMRKHTGEKPYECNICLKRFGQRGHLQYHFKKHTAASCLYETNEERNDSNRNADSVSVTPNKLETQESVMKERASSHSTQLEKVYKMKNGIEMGNDFVTEENERLKNYRQVKKSTILSQRRSDSTPLSGRIFDHVNPSELKAFVCVTCNCGFGEVSSLRAHVRHSHPKKQIAQGKYECAYCNKIFPEVHQLQDHFESTHFGSNSIIAPTIDERCSQKSINDPFPHKLCRTTSAIFFPRDMRSPSEMSSTSDTTYDRTSALNCIKVANSHEHCFCKEKNCRPKVSLKSDCYLSTIDSCNYNSDIKYAYPIDRRQSELYPNMLVDLSAKRRRTDSYSYW